MKYRFIDNHHYISVSVLQSLELLMEKKEEICRGVRGHAPPENFESRD